MTVPYASTMAGLRMAGFSARSAAPVVTQFVPHRAFSLFFDLSDQMVVGDSEGDVIRGSVAAGITPGALRGGGSSIECLQVRLSPLVAFSVLGAPAGLSDRVVTLEQVWGPDAARLEDQLRDAASWEERFAIATAAVSRRCQSGPAMDPEVVRAWRRIVSSHGLVRIAELCSDLGWSRKRLGSRFRSQVGLTPKRAARLVRFDVAVHRLAAGESPAGVAADCGYADQSHLHRDVKAFAGSTPAAIGGASWLAVDEVAWRPAPVVR